MTTNLNQQLEDGATYVKRPSVVCVAEQMFILPKETPLFGPYRFRGSHSSGFGKD
jgi:hypothetical protein